MANNVKKGFIQDGQGNTLLPITRAELVLDKNGLNAFHSTEFVAQLPDTDKNFLGLPGLMTAAEKALLHTLGSEGSTEGTIANIYADLETLFGIGITVDGSDLSYFDSSKVATPISFISGEGISLGVDTNQVTVGLKALDGKTETSQVSGIVNDMTVDEYGRVTNVSTTTALSSVTLENAVVLKDFDGKTFVTSPETVGYVDKANAVVYKRYVDEKFGEALGVATGSLKFIGVFNPDHLSVTDYLDNNLKLWNVGSYMLVGAQCDIPSKYITGVQNDSHSPVNIGDTLIVKEDSQHNKLLVIIPSGDETFVATEINVTQNGNIYMGAGTGSVYFEYGSEFALENENNDESVYIGINKLSSPQENATDQELQAFKNSYGIISGEDYISFSHAAQQSVNYTPEFKKGDSGAYKIGEITFGTSIPTEIYGQYNTYTLDTSQVTSTDPNTHENKVNVTLASEIEDITDSTISVEGDGITVEATNTGLKLSKILIVNDNSGEYLDIDDDVFTIKTGNYTETKNDDGTSSYKYTGLATYEQAVQLVQAAWSEAEGSFVRFEYIKNPLSQNTGTDEDGKPIKYSYGAQLAAAVNIEI